MRITVTIPIINKWNVAQYCCIYTFYFEQNSFSCHTSGNSGQIDQISLCSWAITPPLLLEKYAELCRFREDCSAERVLLPIGALLFQIGQQLHCAFFSEAPSSSLLQQVKSATANRTCSIVMFALGFPRGIKSMDLWNRFSRPRKSIEFGQNVHELLKKYENFNKKRRHVVSEQNRLVTLISLNL